MHRKPHSYSRGELAIVLDCADLDRAADFWTRVLGYDRAGTASGPYLGLLPADGQGAELLLQRVTDLKGGKNRMHLDLRTRDLETEVARVTGLGAARISGRPITEGGWRWHILADPDGNEFCVLQPPASYWQA